MEDIEGFEARGDRARLFPVLADGSKEKRTLSVVLATLGQVPEFGAALLSAINRKHGKRTRFECFTEVTFPKRKADKARPDGLIVVHTGRTQWTALVEAKIGNAALEVEQIETYLKLARDTKINAVITISNDFAPLPEHHPLEIDKRLTRSVGLYHFSWYWVLTTINNLAANEEVQDSDHEFLLRELERFLVHPSAGLKRFDSMGPEWKELLERLRAGGKVAKTASETAAVVGNWHSELRDLCLLLSRKTGANAELKLSSRHRSSPRDRLEDDAKELAEHCRLAGVINVPNVAAPINVDADLNNRTARVSMKLSAPQDRKRQRSRLNWLLKQLKDVKGDDVIIQANWPATAPQTSTSLEEARTNEESHTHPNAALLPTSFVVMKIMTNGKRFSGQRTFIESLEQLVVGEFYGSVAQRLAAWQPPAPKLRDAVEETDERSEDEA